MSRRSTQRDRYYEKMKNKAEVTGQTLSVLMMASRFKKHRKHATVVLNNVQDALKQVEETSGDTFKHTKQC